MSLKPAPIPAVPEATARVARAAFPKGSVVMHLRDDLGPLYTDDQFADLFPAHGQPAEAPWRLAFVTVLQFMEHLTDRHAADAVRRCLDWKYSLSLDLTDPGFDHTVLSEFRSRLVEGQAELRLLERFLERCGEGGLAQSTGAATHGLHPCPGEGACPQPTLVRRPDDGLRSERAGGSGSRLGARLGAHRLVRTLWRAARA